MSYENLLIGLLGGLIGAIVGSILTHFFNKKYFVYSLVTESKFKLYNSLWNSLSNLKKQGEILWANAIPRNLIPFSKALFELKDGIENNRLILDKDAYDKVREIIKKFEDFRTGKESLIQRRQNRDISQSDIDELIKANSRYKKQYESLMENILLKFKKKINQ